MKQQALINDVELTTERGWGEERQREKEENGNQRSMTGRAGCLKRDGLKRDVGGRGEGEGEVTFEGEV